MDDPRPPLWHRLVLVAVVGVLCFVWGTPTSSAQAAPTCTLEDPTTGAAITVPTTGLVGVDCDGPGTVTVVVASPDPSGFGGIAVERPEPRPATIVEALGEDPGGIWWQASSTAPECNAVISAETPHQFFTECTSPPAGGADLILSVHFTGPVLIALGNFEGGAWTVSDVVVEPYAPPPTSTTTTTTVATTSTTTTTVPDPDPEPVDPDETSPVGSREALQWLAFLASFYIGHGLTR